MKHYSKVFVWQHIDKTGVNCEVIEHNLNVIPGRVPIKQKKGQVGDRNNVINVEVTKLVNTSILREAIFPTWIADLVIVKKPDRLWMMCINYSDLNNACLKDHYPLPELEQKVESLEGFHFNCFLDAYKGYHQVQMNRILLFIPIVALFATRRCHSALRTLGQHTNV